MASAYEKGARGTSCKWNIVIGRPSIWNEGDRMKIGILHKKRLKSIKQQGI